MGKAFQYKRGVSLADRFWTKVHRRDPNECWPWLASLDSRGYGNFGVLRDGRFVMQRAHRVAWELTRNDNLAAGVVLCHSCDNRRCVNPAHLFTGTQRDNMADCVAKGRLNDRAGECNPRAKLSARAVAAIRASDLSLARLAALHGVAKSTIAAAKSGKSWGLA